MPQRTLAKVAKFAITMEEELLVRWKNIARYRQANFDNEELDDSNEENHHKPKRWIVKYDLIVLKKVFIVRIVVMKHILLKSVNFYISYVKYVKQ